MFERSLFFEIQIASLRSQRRTIPVWRPAWLFKFGEVFGAYWRVERCILYLR